MLLPLWKELTQEEDEEEIKAIEKTSATAEEKEGINKH